MSKENYKKQQKMSTRGNFEEKTKRKLNYDNEKFKFLNKYFSNLIDNDKFLGSKIDNCFNTANKLYSAGKISSDDCDELSNDICKVIERTILILSECEFLKIHID